MEKFKSRKCIGPAMLLVALFQLSCASKEEKEFPDSFSVIVVNPTPETRYDAMVFIPAEEFENTAFNSKAFIVLDDGQEIPSQFNLRDRDYDGIVVVLDSLEGNEHKELTVRYNKTGESPRSYSKRTQAELSHKINGEWKNREYIGGEFTNVDFLRVPPEHKDHSWFIRYEGPGWESDKVGYRFYLDQRNATDVFGKKVKELTLQLTGIDGFDSYHEMQPWGMDVMKTGKSLGIGSIGALIDSSAIRVEFTDSVTCRIVENGLLYSSINTNYYGWKAGSDTVDVRSRISIHAGTRVTEQHLTLSAGMKTLCTGLVKDDKGKLFSESPKANSLGYLATYGQQSLNNDNLGIAVLFGDSNFLGFTEDKYSHIVKLKSVDGELVYYFLAAWEGEPGGIKDEAAFLNYVNRTARELASPLEVNVNKK